MKWTDMEKSFIKIEYTVQHNTLLSSIELEIMELFMLYSLDKMELLVITMLIELYKVC